MIKQMDKSESFTKIRPIGNKPMTCAEFQDLMPELSFAELESHEHPRHCVRCTTLIADLKHIVDAASILLEADEPGDEILPRLMSSIQAEAPPNASTNGANHLEAGPAPS